MILSGNLINSGALKKLNRSLELENMLKLINVAEKHLMLSVEDRIIEIKDLEVVFDHFINTYFVNDNMIFYGEKFVDYNQMGNLDYLTAICDSELYSNLKRYEEKLLINSIFVFSGILENFGNAVSI